MGEHRYHITTRIEKDDLGWWCVCDIGKILSGHPAMAGPTVEAVQPLRVGPWPSRQVARKELRGNFRKIVVRAVQSFTKKHKGYFEKFEVNDGV